MESEKKSDEAKIKKPIYKKWYFWVIILVVALIIISGSLGVSGRRGDVSENDSVSGDEISSGEKEPDKELDKTYYIGESVTVGGFEYTVTAVKDTCSIYSGGSEIITENNFINIDVTVRNIEDSSKFFYSRFLVLLCGNKKISADYATDGLASGYTMNAGIKRSFTITFETPSKSSDEDYVLQVGVGNNTKLIALKIFEE